MAFGDKLMKKVAGKTPADDMRSVHSDRSLLSTGSSGSGDAAPVARPHHRPPSSKLHGVGALSSVAASAKATPEIIQKGYLLVKKGMLKGYEKRFYFLTAHSPDLFSFRDEFQFDEWLASGLPVRRIPSHRKQRETAPGGATMPTDVLTVLRADRAGDASAIDRAIAVISGDETKCTSTKFLAPTAEACEDWIQSFHRVQLTRRAGASSLRDFMPLASCSQKPMDDLTPSSHSGRTPHSYEARAAPATAQTPLSSGASSRLSDVSDSPSQHSVHSGHALFGAAPQTHTPSHHHTTSSTVSGSAPAPAPPASGNVLLFVPAAGSAISISDSKLQQAKKEMDELIAKGAKRPVRGGLENSKASSWRYGQPEYILSDLEYIKGKTRDDESTPLESYIEACCQTFLMEATHKARYQDWTSVRQEYFYVQVNDGEKIPGHQIKENDLFGLLYLNDYEVDMDLREGEERKDPRAILSEAFTQGFPMEVLDVYTQPPQCHFSWRHWGRFTGRYRGVRGNGELVELRGFGHMHIDSGRILNLQLFFKQRDLFDQLNKLATATLTAAPVNRANRQATVASATDAGVNVKAPAAVDSTQQAPQPQKPQATPQQQQTQQLRHARSDKVSVDNLIGDFRAMGVAAPQSHRAQPQAQSQAQPPASSSHPTPAPKRTNLYQQFMPQATGA